jgi:methylphosphotriester-DNA--protein-cysteine methyltransferase
MIKQHDLGAHPFERLRKLYLLIRAEKVTFAGNRHLKIYGTLACTSGKRMQSDNRVFFTDEADAQFNGYRPCGHCCKAAYLLWKNKKHGPTDNSA